MSNKDTVDALKQVQRQTSAEINCIMPGIITDYNFTSQIASVKPAVRPVYKDGSSLDTPIITGVPVVFPSSGGASLTFPVNPGDPVLLLYADRNLDNWLERGGVQNAVYGNLHSMNDAIAIPGILPQTKPSQAQNNTDVLLTFKGNSVTITPDGKVEVDAVQSIDLTAPIVNINAATTNVTGNLIIGGSITGNGAGTSLLKGTWIVDGDVVANGISLAGHTHANPEGGNVGGPQ